MSNYALEQSVTRMLEGASGAFDFLAPSAPA